MKGPPGEAGRERIPRRHGDDGEDGVEFDMERARFEVQKYGITGFQGEEKDLAMTALLVKLGAKVRPCVRFVLS